jgi:hypothetical protein
MGAALLAASTFATGCSHKAGDKGGSVSVSANALTKADIDHVMASVSGAGIVTPYNVPMGKKNGSDDWKAMVSGIPAGAVVVQATAYKADGTVLFQGSIPSTITDGGTATINITMFEFHKNIFTNSAPVISAIQVSSTTVDPLASIGVGVVASDPDGDALTYAWTSSCGGTFSAPTAATGNFTAPATAGACVLTVKVTDTHTASNTATVGITVGHAVKGNANITATPDLIPTITGIMVNVTNPAGTDAPFVASNQAHLSVSAADANTPPGPLTYAWAFTGCAGAFDSTIGTATASPVFVLSGATGTCTFTVTVTDAAGGFNTGTLTLPVQAAAGNSAVAPTIIVSSQSSDQAYAGQTLYFYVSYAFQTGDGWTVDWTPSTGTGTASNDYVAFTSSFAWTTPTGLTDGTALAFTVRITDVSKNLSVSQTFTATAASDQCAGKVNGTTCVGTNMCFGTYTCQSGTCTGSAAVDCSVGQPICQDSGVCNPATGACSYQMSNNGVTCSDGKACTGTTASTDKCDGAGTCVAGPVNCPATTAQCLQGGGCDTAGACIPVTPKSSATSCNDGLACTGTTGSPDHCDGAGACASGADNCSGSTNVCITAGTCIMSGTGAGTCGGGTINTGLTCANQDLCTINSACDSTGACVGSPKCPAGWGCNLSDGSCIAPLCMAPQYGVDWNVMPAGLATDLTGNVFTGGTMYGLTASPIAFGSVNIGAGAGANAYAARLNPTTGATVWAKAWGDDNDQQVLGVAASKNNVAVIGNYIGSMGISSLPANSTLVPVDMIVGLDPASGNPAWGTKIDLGGGGMASIYSNPLLDNYYVCGSSVIAATDLSPSLTAGAVDGTTDIVVAKINGANGAVLWARQIGGAGAQSCSSITADVATDGTVNAVYLTGTYNGTLDFGNSVGAFATIGNGSRQILWAAKLADSDGHSLAAKTWGTLGSQTISSITTDPSSNVLIAGALVQNIPFGGAAGTITASGTDAFVVKLDSSLTPLWAQKWGDSNTQAMRGIATDSSGNIFAVGLFSGQITVGANTITATGAAADIFTMKIASDGTLGCMASYGAAGADEADMVVVNRFASTASGQKDMAVFSGALAGSVSFGSGITLTTPTTGTQYGFVVGINPNSL